LPQCSDRYRGHSGLVLAGVNRALMTHRGHPGWSFKKGNFNRIPFYDRKKLTALANDE
jgi:hypothetical protein